ncbi:MAG: hypothetical protein QFF03_06125 [Pseudomonadota bacterium]|nr:hypothetical protein [Pseudomonadota bacterium]
MIWLFPFLMGIIEFVVRASLRNPDAVGFFGPTIGGAALGMMLPMTHAKEMSAAERNSIVQAADIVVFRGRDARWAQRANVALWMCLAGWAASLYLSLAGSRTFFPQLDGERSAILIGIILWIVAVIFDRLRREV